MAITRAEVLKIAGLANLHFEESELEAFTAQFQRILDYIEKLEEVDIGSVEPTSHVSLSEDFEKHIFREDVTRPGLPVEEALRNAPDSGEGHFLVPKVI